MVIKSGRTDLANSVSKYCLLTAVSLVAFTSNTLAHPHVYSDLRSDIVLDDQGFAIALNIEWIFDAGYTEAAIEGMDADNDGVYTPAELHPVATENINALKEYTYFVKAKSGNTNVTYSDVTEYGQRLNDDGRLAMTFVIPFATPVDLKSAEFSYKVYDPDFFIAYDYIKGETVGVIGTMPQGCSVNLGTVQFDEQVQQTQQMLADKPADWQPEQPQDFGSLFAQPVTVSCKPAGS